jgi:hypothetical protein
LIATRHGVWRLAADGDCKPLNSSDGIPYQEAQSLCKAPDGLWIGTRTGLYYQAM